MGEIFGHFAFQSRESPARRSGEVLGEDRQSASETDLRHEPLGIGERDQALSDVEDDVANSSVIIFQAAVSERKS